MFLLFRFFVLCVFLFAPLSVESLTIVGGEKATDGEFPFAVAILRFGEDVECGGSLIREDWVLTAAHCFTGIAADDLLASAGQIALGKMSDVGKTPGSQLSEIEAIYSHPLFDEQVSFDIALVKLKEPFNVTASVKPIEMMGFNGVLGMAAQGGNENGENREKDEQILLSFKEGTERNDTVSPSVKPTPSTSPSPKTSISPSPAASPTKNAENNNGNSEIPPGSSITFVGWGDVATDVHGRGDLLKLELPMLNASRCTGKYPGAALTPRDLCAGGVPGKDTCNGDSGGPAVIKNEQGWVLVGVQSRGTTAECANIDTLVLSTMVSEFKIWIKSTIAMHSAAARKLSPSIVISILVLFFSIVMF